ncbi:MAG: non-homologous end-joining DNA ligase [Opitutaceae bacterium]|nr:non-homologous end-joining DNA ligase [Opitutaceae bacterium]
MPHQAKALRPVSFSNPDKLYFPNGFTKGQMIRYYLEVAPFILPHLENRPVTLIRFPDGVKGGSFYEKDAPKHAPDWITTFRVPRNRHEGYINYILVNNPETLAWCANLGAIEFHPFLHRVPDIDTPTHVAFDLDPGEGADIFACIEVAMLLKDVFDGLRLESFPKVSGSKGIQIYVPLNTPVTYAATQPFAKSVAELLERQHPGLIISAMAKALRKKKVMIDWSQNTQSKTTVCVYAMRGKRDEPYISMPLTWVELTKARKAKDRDALFFTPDEALKRVRKLGDLFAPVLTTKQQLPDAFLQLKPRRRSRRPSPGWRGRDATAEPPASSPPPTKGRRSSLARYAAKRDFTQTAEPGAAAPAAAAPEGALRFVIQKHAASHLHYDFRLEMDGTLKSWAVPKGPPYELGVKRAAFEVEDHPIDYLRFEGTIPKGQYGGGTVMVWDIGTYELLRGSHEKGDLKLRLHGKKMKGEWHIFRIKSDSSKPMWLLAKSGPPAKAVSARQDDRSVLTGRSMARIAADNDAEWQSNRRSKEDKRGPAAPKTAKRRTSNKPAAKRASRRTQPKRRRVRAGHA